MKTKALILIGLVLQVCFLLFVMVQAPEPHGAIKVGLNMLKENSPAQGLTITETTGNVWNIKTAGDYFFMADDWFRFIIKVSIGFLIMSIIVSISTLISLRKKKEPPAEKPSH